MSAARIGALLGEDGAGKQRLLADFVARRRRDGFKIAGVIETAIKAESDGCGALDLIDLATGARIPITQNLGSGSIACNLDPSGLACACAAALSAIRSGADLVVLSKFGKLEASGGGLCDAFGAALLADIPVLTTVRPVMRDAWREFSGDFAEDLDFDAQALESWWLAVKSLDVKLENMQIKI